MSGNKSEIKICPLISTVQRIGVYETKARFFVIGSNMLQGRFRMLKIDRTEPRELHILDDDMEYSYEEIRGIMRNLDEGNRTRSGGSSGQGLVRKVSAFGIVGFVRFTEGYYIIVITQRRRIAIIGTHIIYKIEDTKMIYIPSSSKKHHPDEQRYVRLFQSIGMGSNFYFSYSYDLTHSLQYNVALPQLSSDDLKLVLGDSKTDRTVNSAQGDVETSQWCPVLTSALPSDTVSAEATPQFVPDTSSTGAAPRPAGVTSSATGAAPRPSGDTSSATGAAPRPAGDTSSSTGAAPRPAGDTSSATGAAPRPTGHKVVGVRAAPARRFVWNWHLLLPAVDQMGWQWRLHITHGYLGQALLYLHGRNVFLTLLARRSSLYAGTRFLKRGASYAGDVANEVETEQIVHDASVSSLQYGLFSSHVQLRGSVPCHWCQDSNRIPKPPIQIDLHDPCHLTSGKHLNDLLSRYGAPVFAVNLVKKNEKRSHESLLHREFRSAVVYLNRFLPYKSRVRYISFDMARVNKLKRENVMLRLTQIADCSLQETGFFLSQPPLASDRRHISQFQVSENGGLRQTGVVRVNCVDCLDRTNTAQFAVGKSALSLQLYCMGAIASPSLAFDTDCLSILEDMFEDHGDMLALQYGGSQLVHRIRTYRKTAHWGSQGSDIVQTMQRYYSNTFSDSDKQSAINLFLGAFVPEAGKPALWELPNDFLLHHHREHRDIYQYSRSQWWTSDVMQHLPYPAAERMKRQDAIVVMETGDERVDSFRDCYRPHEFSSLSELFTVNMTHSVRDYMPAFCVDESPFAVRSRRQAAATAAVRGTPLVSQCNSSAGSDVSESGGTSSADELLLLVPSAAARCLSSSGDLPVSGTLALHTLLPSARTVYGLQIVPPSQTDLTIYKRYVSLGCRSVGRRLSAQEALVVARRPLSIVQRSQLKLDSSREVAPPAVSRKNMDIYRMAVKCSLSRVNKSCLDKYRKYVAAAAIPP